MEEFLHKRKMFHYFWLKPAGLFEPKRRRLLHLLQR